MTRSASLLVVDDSAANRDVLSRRLRLAGHRVALAASGEDALAAVAAEKFDLVLLDVEMPGITGFDALGQLRQTYSQTELPIIMVTALSSGGDIVEAFRLGANDYVTKPIDFPVAFARIGTHLAHKWAVEALHESEERYAVAVQGANDGLWDWNLVTNEVHWSPRWKAILGHADAEVSTAPDEWFDRVHPDDRAKVRAAVQAVVDGERAQCEIEHRIRHRDGTFRWVLCRGGAVRNAAGSAIRLAGSLSDVTDVKFSDTLTGLPNRLLFVDLLDHAIKRTERHRESMFALVVLGLDRFRMVGDTFGPLTADRLLAAVARRLEGTLREESATRDVAGSTLARLGGDEFTVLLEDIVDASDAVRIADRLRRALEDPFDVDAQQVFTSATAGVAVSTTGYHRPEEMLRDAAIALHRAKADAASPCELFDPEMRARATDRLQLETDLRYALANGSFVMHYQPIVEVESGRVAGFEALVRWRHAKRGMVNPMEFIRLAENTGLIGQIGKLTLAQSCQQMAAWTRRFPAGSRAFMCVNVSSRQFADPGLAREIESALAASGLDGRTLKLEITESAFIDDVSAARKTVERLQSIGVEWSLDDFGTGYSSLSHLHQLHVGTLKIDRSFVSRLGVDQRGNEMVRAIIALARNLSMDVVAEGVETEAQFDALRRLGCDYAQGFYFSQAVDAEAAGRLIDRQPWHARAALPRLTSGQARVPVSSPSASAAATARMRYRVDR